ncbi:MAG: AIR synthase-related protein [Patescibacteria group bacterium]|nr:AIR synthase-related protein [Patescibacteria group bacterium]
MAKRIEIFEAIPDARAKVRLNKLRQGFDGYSIKNIQIVDVYTVDKNLTQNQFQKAGEALANPLSQYAVLSHKKFNKAKILGKFDWVIEVGFLPGVTDNIARTAKEIIEDLLKISFSSGENIYTSQSTYILGKLTPLQIEKIASSLYNPLIQRVHLKSYRQYTNDGGMDTVVPVVRLENSGTKVEEVSLEISDDKLAEIGKKGIANPDGTRRGPLALDLYFMKTIQKYFRKTGRKPTDVELESLGQTWSEHCKHTIFADPLDDLKEGLFKSYIKRATEEIRRKKGKKDFCVSVFSDNSGAIAFDHDFLITHKVETHNSPSALDPFGGAITGIVGVNRDTLGFGLGAKPVANFYGYCFADPRIDITLFKGPKKKQRILSSRRILDGVVEGVNAGGNQSGIPTPQGFVFFDEKYRGKPLVFVGTVGLIPKKIKNKMAWKKHAKPGDYIVMAGGRVGKDGIHGATFSSESLNEGSPATAVQIGDPITQKKLSDVMVREAREMLLYDSITDNGAGGLSSSVAEMAKEAGGCMVELEKVPLKYPGLAPWEIWLSESQERMTLAVPKNKWKKLSSLMERRGVEATVIGEFTNSGKCTVYYRGRIVMDLDMTFLHYGLPKRIQKSSQKIVHNKEPKIPIKRGLTNTLLEMVGRLNIASYEFISEQYDHVVLGGSVLGPLQGKGRVNAEASVTRPLLSSKKGLVLSQGLYPRYSDIDTYHMAASSLDCAVRNCVTAGADPNNIALLDNFCWCSSNEPERLWELKRAVQACYDLAKAYGTPFISGKDSMFNDFHGFDSKGNQVNISIPPTLLISSLGIINDVTFAVSLDAKATGDLVYVLGETSDELGASEYFIMMNERAKKNDIGNNVPRVDARRNMRLYKSYFECVRRGLVASAQSLGIGGLAVALAKTAIGGMLGVDVNLMHSLFKSSRNDFILYSESQGRILVTVSPKNQKIFERLMQGCSFAQIGKIVSGGTFRIKGLNGINVVDTSVGKLLKAYRKTFKDY